MNQFYLNNIVGAPSSLAEGVSALCNAALAFGELSSDKSLNVSERVVMDKDPDLTTFGEFYLGQLVDAIPDEIEKRMAYVLLKAAYPMEDHLPWNEKAEPIIEGDYKYNEEDASNLAVAQSHGAMILSFAFSDVFKKNTLALTSAAEPSEKYPPEIVVENLYGSDENTAFIRGVLQEREGVSVDLFKEICGYGIVHHAVERAFRKQTPDIQESIAKGFKDAILQGLLVPHAGDGNNVITPDANLVRRETHTKKEALLELAISNPKVMRVFIAQNEGELYILDIKSKEEMGDGGVNQNKALRAAEDRFVKMKQSS